MPQLTLLTEQLLAPVPGGTGRYTRELASALAATAPDGWSVTGAVAKHHDPQAAMIPGLDGLVQLPLNRRALAAAWSRGVAIWPGGDAVHAPTPLAPPRPLWGGRMHHGSRARGRGSALVVTVHDAVAWSHPESLTRNGASWHRRAISAACKNADAVVVPTDTVAAELSAVTTVRGPLHVIGEGVAPALSLPPGPQTFTEIAHRLRLPERYILAVGTLEPRKGIDVLLQAMSSSGANDGSELPLLLVGPQGWGQVYPTRLAESLELPAGRVRWLGSLTDTELAVTLHKATALAVPSHAEGFGLPLLEAMASGVPVVHSDAPALVEVAGGSGLTVPRGDPERLAQALRRVATDGELVSRMVRLGRQRALSYTWEGAARRIWRLHLSLWERNAATREGG